jgi:hypothetical protein
VGTFGNGIATTTFVPDGFPASSFKSVMVKFTLIPVIFDFGSLYTSTNICK